MGQAPQLLTLPGFFSRPSLLAPFLSSNDFAEYVSSQWQALRHDSTAVQFLSGIVESIERDPIDGFTITVVAEAHGTHGTQTRITLHADFVDICTGFGESKADLKVTLPTELEQEWRVPLSRPRRIYTGDEFLRGEIPVPRQKLICIVGDGPTAALCCERAALTNDVHWVVRTAIGRALPPSDRIETVTLNIDGGTIAVAEGYQTNTIKLAGGRIIAEFTAARGQKQKYKGNTGNPRLPIECDTLVIAIGHENHADELVRNEDWDLLECERFNFPVGLRIRNDEGVRVRILGAAALTSRSFGMLLDRRTAPNALKFHAKSLPLQVQLPPKAESSGRPNASIAVVARLIGEANGFFEEHSVEFGPNWNCAFRPNIRECLNNRHIPYTEEDIDNWCRTRARIMGPVTEIPGFASGCGDLVYHCRAQGAAG